MDKFVITIARSYGSGGKQIAMRLAEALDVKYYDRELIKLVSEQTGINEALFNLTDETRKSKNPFKKYINKKSVTPDNDEYLSSENLFNLQADYIRKLADNDQSCIIVGRCANHVLRDYKNVVNVFIHADHKNCIENVKEYNGVDDAEAKILIEKFDRERANYHKYFTDSEWNDARNYDVCLDTSKVDFDKCVKIIIEYLKIKQGLSE
ncbi:MAG: cytidylate kinase-like family protein [Firmicutes bacterium]|nr:cytidylate kinase-like family protein [Bacillota bacterium]